MVWADRTLQPGTVIAGYRIESVLGRGGTGVVYKAVHERLGRTVAANELTRVNGRTELRDADAVCIVALLGEDRQPSYWELSFDDRGRTRGVSISLDPACIAYDETEARCFVTAGSTRHELSLRPQAHRLVRFMAERNAEAGGTPVLCSHDELVHAVWADEPMHMREELNKLFWELRRKLEPFGAQDVFESERGLGYRMRTC